MKQKDDRTTNLLLPRQVAQPLDHMTKKSNKVSHINIYRLNKHSGKKYADASRPSFSKILGEVKISVCNCLM